VLFRHGERRLESEGKSCMAGGGPGMVRQKWPAVVIARLASGDASFK